MAWLKNILPEIPHDEPLVFCSHFPFEPDFIGKSTNYLEIPAMLKKQNLIAVLAGHLHCS